VSKQLKFPLQGAGTAKLSRLAKGRLPRQLTLAPQFAAAQLRAGDAVPQNAGALA